MKNKRIKRIAITLAGIIACSLFIVRCAPPIGEFAADPTPAAAASYSNYIVASNTATKSVVLLDPDGAYVCTLLRLSATSTEVPYGIAVYDSESILITVEGLDRVMKANLRTCTSENYIVDTNLTGTMRGITRLSGGDILISEGAAAGTTERYSSGSAPTRLTITGFPVNYQNTVTEMDAFTTGTANRWIQCSTGTDVVRVYGDTGTQLFSANSVAPAPTLGAVYDVVGCSIGPGEEIAAAYSGANDAVRVYTDGTLATTKWTYQNASILTAPLSVSFRPDGKVLAADTNNLLIELNSDGSFSRTISTAFISTVNKLQVIP